MPIITSFSSILITLSPNVILKQYEADEHSQFSAEASLNCWAVKCRQTAARMSAMSFGLMQQQPPIHVAPAFIHSPTYSFGRFVTVLMCGHLHTHMHQF